MASRPSYQQDDTGVKENSVRILTAPPAVLRKFLGEYRLPLESKVLALFLPVLSNDRKINPGAIPIRRADEPGIGVEHVPGCA